MTEEKYTLETVLSVKKWAANLFSFTMTRPAHFRFTAGQFARIGLQSDGELIVRAYSVVSSPFDETLEFFSIVVPDGAFTSKLQNLKAGDQLYLEKIPYGFLTLARYQQPTPHDLWLLATGTGLAPFLSMLQDFDTWQKYRYIVLAYSVRTSDELAYVERIREIQQIFAQESDAEFIFLPIITRDPFASLNQRLPKLIESGQLEKAADLKLHIETSHVMLCGNPQMVEDTKEALKSIGLVMNRRGVGNIAVENYW
ncbi:ferredoxin--NADP reductase [Acinetobacter qingfengensis]|uniref:ferredoxin--NADP(+) reductase n=1 Tax=Acinetobacter qingfengensis TaxID=1262585 RepID=A0A1E7RDJ1_9GAMM|nr:ferredoxin--NADP reductase [Acinetobacter qingfengensis]KAA8734451.1 ferredoxin--NADP reductase [Acinetobacter qingfengensis]OEY97363.1 ferredoxin--NADP(+) reductase [Acinetobacter qingfengensis]